MLMEMGAVTFVAGEAVSRVLGIEFAHEGIPGGLGQNGCAGNAKGKPVAFDQGGLVPFELGENQVVGYKIIRDQVIRD